MSLILIYPASDIPGSDARLSEVLSYALEGVQVRILRRAEEFSSALAGQTLLFALPLGDAGVNLEYVRMLARLRREHGLLEGCTAGLMVDGSSLLYTKSAAAELTFAANLAGCSFLGRPLVSGTGELVNFRIQARNLSTDLMGAYRSAARELVQRLTEESFPRRSKPELLVLHASTHRTSNTMALWRAAKERLGEENFVFTEIGLRNGTVADCSGCPYTTCLHFGERDGCFYGGVIQEAVYPAIRRCAGVVMLCPNYNDALSANLTAFINRLTGLFRQTRFYDKAIFSIVVSGYSGGDIVARQLIAAMNMNKSFYLPGRFALIETANDPGEALSLPGIQGRLDEFAGNIRHTLAE